MAASWSGARRREGRTEVGGIGLAIVGSPALQVKAATLMRMGAFQLTDQESELLACRLDPAEQRELMAAYDRLARDHVIGIEREPMRLTVTLRVTPDTESQAQRIVDVERECCPFMSTTLEIDRDRLILRYSGAEIIGPIIDVIEERLRAA